MGTLNIYKIDNDKLQNLMQTLNQKMQQMGTQTIPEPIGETRENQPIRCELYYEDGKPDINRLDMLMLKNRLDQWKKEVRLQGYTPIIYVNYRTN